jgi:hypothetical protein
VVGGVGGHEVRLGEISPFDNVGEAAATRQGARGVATAGDGEDVAADA